MYTVHTCNFYGKNGYCIWGNDQWNEGFVPIFFKSISFAIAPYLLVNQSLMLLMLLIHNKIPKES